MDSRHKIMTFTVTVYVETDLADKRFLTRIEMEDDDEYPIAWGASSDYVNPFKTGEHYNHIASLAFQNMLYRFIREIAPSAVERMKEIRVKKV